MESPVASVDTPSCALDSSVQTPPDVGDVDIKPEQTDAQCAGLTQAMVEEEAKLAQESLKEEEKRLEEEAKAVFDSSMKEQRMKRLNFLLEKSGAYATILGNKMAKQQEQAREKSAKQNVENGTDASGNEPKQKPARKRRTNDTEYQLSDYLNENDVKRRKQSNDNVSKAIQMERERAAETPTNNTKPSMSTRQPKLVTGGIMRDYQLAGVEWLISLWENGLNGILADEMGLGKTLQTIAFLAHLKEMSVSGYYLIVTPLSTLANWVNEFKRFAPDIPVVLYHGAKDDRQHIRRRKMSQGKNKSDFLAVVTSYEIVMNDRKYLQRYDWKHIIVDEGHRIKNMNCKLIRELKTYRSENRLLLTGTPLQNNLAELWSLLNFLLPDIFDDIDMFESWFNFSDINQKSGQDRIIKEEEEDQIVTRLHTILKPFLLRRLKTDVEHSLPRKKEYLLYAPLTQPQKSLYDAIIKRDLRGHLIRRKTNVADAENEITTGVDENMDVNRKVTRQNKAVSYKEKSDREFFAEVNKPATTTGADGVTARLQHQEKAAIKHVNGLHLQNIVMQLRKVCNHPFLFDWPIDPSTNMPVLNNDLVAQSGKVMILDRLLTALFDRGHKVLVFSQMTKMLDVLEDWANDIKGWRYCRLDGSVSQEARREQIEQFNDPSSTVNLFLLSTRAGGLGINLTAADTVVIFDSDWNPQMDLQAQDRVHRIGQTKPVLIYRLVAANTVEAKILEKASSKRRLEKLVISKGKFKAPVSSMLASTKKDQESTVRELADILASEDGEQVQIVSQGDKVISDEDLEKLLDRSPEVFEESTTSASGGFREIDTSEMLDQKNEVLATRG